MAKSRSTRSNLYQLLNDAQRPVYVLDASSRIVFANLALCEWLGVEGSELEFQQCVLTTDRLADENLNRVRGLAAPPELFEKKAHTGAGGSNGSRVFRNAADGHLIWREAQFVKLVGDSFNAGEIIVCVSDADLPTQSPAVRTRSTHDLINQLRTAQIQKFGFDHFVGVSPQSQLLARQISVASESDCDLMIVGESGSEREALARAIHAARQASNESGKSGKSDSDSVVSELIPIHGAVADGELVQTTILSVRERAGECGGLLLLDVDRLTTAAAQELVGFLEHASPQLRAIATCSSVEQVSPKLAERLCVLRLHIAPLRERKSDMPLLAQLLLTKHTGNAKAAFDDAALRQIVDYDWPGNMEELKQTIEGVSLEAIEANRSKVTLADLPERFEQALQAQQIGRPQIVEIQLDDYLADIESQLIQRAMAFAGNNKAQASKLLGISRAKLGRRIQQLADERAAEDPVVFEETQDDE